MKDGLNLARVISAWNGEDIPEMLKQYEQEMIERGTYAVRMSHEAALARDSSGKAAQGGWTSNGQPQ